MSSKGATQRLAFLCVLLLGAALRMQHVTQLYVDGFAWREADTASIAEAFAAGHWNIFMPEVRWGGPGPNYVGAEFQTVSYIVAIGYRLFGTSATTGRVVSTAFGLWGIFALYMLVSRVWDQRRALSASAVMAVLPGSVIIERSFLSDGAMTALMTSSLWMLVAHGQTRRDRYLYGAALFGLLGCLTKLPGCILAIPAAYSVLSIYGERLYEPGVGLRIGTALLTVAVPVAAYYLWERHVSLAYPPHHLFGQDKFVWNSGITAWLSHRYFLGGFWQHATTLLWTIPFMALAVVGFIVSCRDRNGSTGSRLFHYWFLAMGIRYLLEADHLVSDPYNIHLFNPVIAVFAGQALISVADSTLRLRSPPLGTVAAILLFAGSSIYAQLAVQQWFDEPYRSHYVIGQTLSELSQPGDLVITMGLEPVALYHSRRMGWIFPPGERASDGGEGWDHGPIDASTLRELRSRGGHWLGIPAWNSYTQRGNQDYIRDTYPALYAEMLEDFEIVRDLPEGLILRAR